MCSARHDLQLLFTTKLRIRFFVQFYYRLVISSYDQKRRRLNQRERFARQVWSSTARDYGTDLFSDTGSSDEGSASASARTEIAYAQVSRSALALDPVGRIHQSVGE